jgi:hypothetical protein
MVEAASALVERLKRGEKSGVMIIGSTPAGIVSSVYGDFADRLQYAVYAATKHLDMLVTKAAADAGVGYSSTGAMREIIPSMEYQQLPRMLRLGGRRG